MRPWLAIGALGCAVGVAAGAFGAHGLASRLDARSLALWETAVRYWFIASLGLLALGLAAGRLAPGLVRGAGLCLSLGALVFSGTVAALALGSPRWLGAITPIGGVLLIIGFTLFAWAAWRMGDG
ncbi:MAG TPA: DUF423 domain-containing protein [Thermoanaerobaculia bacterium]|nr:DUF423 domain-containing protein [Thermoanaerobaculia bacterium]